MMNPRILGSKSFDDSSDDEGSESAESESNFTEARAYAETASYIPHLHTDTLLAKLAGRSA